MDSLGLMDNLELKRYLLYLYQMNYAKSQPDMAIMAVYTFVKQCSELQARENMKHRWLIPPLPWLMAASPQDCEDPNPLIRVLAVRTMGCIRVDKITEYLCEPLRKCLKDEDPYVCKTAAVCVAKLHDINTQLVEDQGFLDTLKDLISDSNPMVVANAVAVLSEIAESHPSSNLLDLNPQSINKLLTALNECTEWDQIFILDCLANYTPKDDREAQRPEILKHEMKVFFVKYNDPIYVKLEKLDIMIHLASQANIAQVLAELKEYATEVDVDFVRKAVCAIGCCAIKVEQSAERCVSTLLDLIQTKVNYVFQEAIVVIKDIFHKYPNKYESVIATLCENLDSLDEPEAGAAMIWIVGEYAEQIDNADELLESFLEGFYDESTQVSQQASLGVRHDWQLSPAVVHAAMKLYLPNTSSTAQRDR
ncbi:AP-1 complex subunit beta-1 [Saguinus oedipus]|uniref:AP-1 complex subunit beta-1 n=1 Tax=Saguinus oedipus TaxID=9490 RepID=A0ABQ9WIE2_SAGOE|nr:AP-1 complex subunit beta-1 [Saguinus oedipus]